MNTTFKCCQCGQTKSSEGCGTGYGTDKAGNKTCYQCIGENDRKELEAAKLGERFTLYLSKDATGYKVTNWPGTFNVSAHVNVGRHNMAGKRYDAYFTVSGNNFHGITYGDNT